MITVQSSVLLENATERTAHHWVDLEDFHAQIMRHTRSQHFSQIRIFASEQVLRQLRELWVSSDERVTFDKTLEHTPGYEYSYRRMPVFTDCQTDDEPRYITEGKYIVAYYGEPEDQPFVAMTYNPHATGTAHTQQAMDFSDDELDLDLGPSKAAEEVQVPTPERRFRDEADAYYNSPVQGRQPGIASPGAYYANPAKGTARASDEWSPEDYGGPANS